MMTKIKQTCIKFWAFMDPIYLNFTRLEHIKKKCGTKTIIRVRITKYKGRKIVLSDGTVINTNDALIKIHLHNVKLIQETQIFDNELKRALIIYKKVQDALPFIAEYIKAHKFSHEIKGLIGITMINKGCEKLGFEIFNIQNRYYKLFKKTALLPIYFLSTSNPLNKIKPSPVYLFMSKEELNKRYNS